MEQTKKTPKQKTPPKPKQEVVIVVDPNAQIDDAYIDAKIKELSAKLNAIKKDD